MAWRSVRAKILAARGEYQVWVTVGALHELVGIDAVTGAVIARVPIGGYPTQVVADGLNVWVVSATSGSGLLFHLDGATGRVTFRRRLTASPDLGIVAVPGGVWLSQPGGVWLSQPGGLLHVSGDGSTSTLPGVGFGPLTWPLSFGAGSLWASDGGQVFRIDPGSGDVLAQIKIRAIGLAFSDGKVWVLTDTASKSRTLYIPNPKHPSTVLYINPGTDRIGSSAVAGGAEAHLDDRRRRGGVGCRV